MDDIDIKELKYLPLMENVNQFNKHKDDTKNKHKSKGGSPWVIRDGIAPVEFYCYLNARFGKPNGLQMLFRADDSDNIIHWHGLGLSQPSRIREAKCLSLKLSVKAGEAQRI